MTRLQRILSAVLALQVVLAAVVFWPRPAAGGESGPLFPDLKTDDIVSITLLDRAGNRTELVRQDDGWVLGGGIGYPVDGTKVEPVLAKIAAIQTNRLVARTSDSHKRLQVAEDVFAERIELRMKDGVLETLLIGSSPNPSGTHVRRATRPETYLTGELASWEVNPEARNWIDTRYVTLDRAEIASMTLVNKNGQFEFTKESEGNWLMADLAEGEELEQSQLNALLSRISSMRMTEPLGQIERADYGLQTPQAKLTVIVEDSEDQSTKSYTLLVGNQDPENDRFTVKWSDSEYYVTVEAFNVEKMVNDTREDFIKEPPTPTPGGEESLETATPTPES